MLVAQAVTHIHSKQKMDINKQLIGILLKTGILTDYSRVYFPNTAHTFWVRDVIEIEVK